MRVLIACEFSGVVRDAFRKRGYDAWSCDVLPSERKGPHYVGPIEMLLCPGHRPWDLMIAHPPCTRLANSGVRWLWEPPRGKTKYEMWTELDEACSFYLRLRTAPIPFKAIENPVMHRHARERIGNIKRQIVQPHWFGDKAFKATGFELHGLPPLQRTHWMELPKKGTTEFKDWSAVHRASPGPDRWKERSRTLPGIAEAMADQWGAYVSNALKEAA